MKSIFAEGATNGWHRRENFEILSHRFAGNASEGHYFGQRVILSNIVSVT